MDRSAATPEKRPPTIPRRKHSQFSCNSERSDRSTPSVQDISRKTVELTPSSGSQEDRVPATPANSRQLVSSSRSAEAKNLIKPDLNERQMATRLGEIAVHSDNDGIITEPKIRAFFRDRYDDFDAICGQSLEAWTLLFERYCSKDFMFIRPSGNPIDRAGFAKMLAVDATVHEIKLVSIESIAIMSGQRSAIVVYTTDQKFSYKGFMNEDRAVITCVLEMREGEIKAVHEHRSSGRPIPKESRWESIG